MHALRGQPPPEVFWGPGPRFLAQQVQDRCRQPCADAGDEERHGGMRGIRRRSEGRRGIARNERGNMLEFVPQLVEFCQGLCKGVHPGRNRLLPVT